eukprot:TRINITY_DN7576_c0_g1_i5.p1 TRINITY_DN7576_c0_g1~~TRINITY_DN7576_c0_g1_i5.p1  ORF type:complete len:219 (+),score=-11.37 TRINITY_DN7576_c0_g1_i5:32-658(+)
MESNFDQIYNLTLPMLIVYYFKSCCKFQLQKVNINEMTHYLIIYCFENNIKRTRKSVQIKLPKQPPNMKLRILTQKSKPYVKFKALNTNNKSSYNQKQQQQSPKPTPTEKYHYIKLPTNQSHPTTNSSYSNNTIQLINSQILTNFKKIFLINNSMCNMDPSMFPNGTTIIKFKHKFKKIQFLKMQVLYEKYFASQTSYLRREISPDIF